jgi:tetratricopeptide (TPR) repeat protein
MKAYVYTDKGLERFAGRFVWLSVNTEDAKNAAFLQKYPIPALPTLLVLDAKHDAVTLRYVGGATVPQLQKMLGDAEKTYRTKSEAASDTLLTQADRLAAAGKHAEAVKAYDSAIAGAPAKWSKLGRSAESMLFSLSMSGDDERCATRALELYPRVKGTVSAANVAATGLSCAIALDASKVETRNTWMHQLETYTREVFDDANITMSADDRSGLYMALIDARDAAGDEEEVLKLKSEWAAFLEDAAAKAKTPAQRTVYDSHRLTAYLDLGTPEKAIPMLEQSERDFPDDYNPPARLAYAYKALEDFAKALAASDRALARVYGPRKLAVLSVRADIYVAAGDTKAARDTILQAIDYAKALPPGQRSEARIKSFEARLAKMQ